MKAIEIAQRRKEITELLYQQNELRVHELVKKFHVSDETIRKDLAYLAQEGILEKHHGKAVLIKEKRISTCLSTDHSIFRKGAYYKCRFSLYF